MKLFFPQVQIFRYSNVFLPKLIQIPKSIRVKSFKLPRFRIPTPYIFVLNRRRYKLFFKNRFRSFFGFSFKIRPFILRSLDFLFKNFLINPRDYSLSIIVKHSKRFPRGIIDYYFYESYRHFYVSKKGLRRLLNKQFNRIWRAQQFLAIKHFIFRYTTPKRAKYMQFINKRIPMDGDLDIRTFMSANTSHWPRVPNSDTFSTYNWKIIN